MKGHKEIKRVFLITVDALRADHVGCIGGGDLTPNIDKMAENGLLFTRAFANGPGTNQSFPALMTSTYFLMHDGFHLSPRYDTLAEVLQRNGFKTAGFHSNPFISKTFGWDRGFDEYYDFMDELKAPSAFITRTQGAGLRNHIVRFLATHFGGNQTSWMRQFLKNAYYRLSELEIPYLEGKELNKQVFNWINRNLDKKFFLWIHYMDPHYPYIPPEEFRDNFSNRKEAFEFSMSIDMNKISDEKMEILKALYKGEVRYTDFCIGELVEFLKKRGLIENSIIFITADHGESFMEHERYGHKPDILYNEVLHVPLLIYGLNNFLATDFPVQLLDVPPTILDILRIERPRSFFGDSLISLYEKNNEHKLIFSESAEPDLINLKYNMNKRVISCIKNGWKLIINDYFGTKELYNIETDFFEKNNLIKSKYDLSENLLQLIQKHLLQW